MDKKLNQTYWNTCYKEGNTGWDLQEISPPLKAYINQLEDKNLKILIPGGGYSFEAQYLWENGFKNVFVVELSELALENLSKRLPSFAKAQLIQGNFFELEDTFDLILEQTFFCALDPKLRTAYTSKMYLLLRPKGKLVGLLFDFPITEKGPPFGGNTEEYKSYFEPYFKIITLERAYNSVLSREGVELFFQLKKW